MFFYYYKFIIFLLGFSIYPILNAKVPTYPFRTTFIIIIICFCWHQLFPCYQNSVPVAILQLLYDLCTYVLIIIVLLIFTFIAFIDVRRRCSFIFSVTWISDPYCALYVTVRDQNFGIGVTKMIWNRLVSSLQVWMRWCAETAHHYSR